MLLKQRNQISSLMTSEDSCRAQPLCTNPVHLQVDKTSGAFKGTAEISALSPLRLLHSCFGHRMWGGVVFASSPSFHILNTGILLFIACVASVASMFQQPKQQSVVKNNWSPKPHVITQLWCFSSMPKDAAKLNNCSLCGSAGEITGRHWCTYCSE